MKILIVGANKPHSLEKIYLKNLSKISIEAAIFDSRSYIDEYRRIYINKFKLMAGNKSIYKLIGKKLLNEIELFKPTVILVFKGMELDFQTLYKIKELNIFLVNYNPDHPFFFSGLGSGNDNIIRNNEIYDLHLTYGKAIKIEIEKKLGIPCEVLPFGYELENDIFTQIKNINEVQRVCFIGHPDRSRASKIKYLVKNNIPITVFGNNWSRYLNDNQNLQIYNQSLYGRAYWEVLRKYRVQLNLFRGHNENTHNMRSFEVPAVGGIMLAPSKNDHSSFFIKNHSFFEYFSDEDMADKCNQLLKMKKEEINNIRENSRRISLNNSYSYLSRSKQLIALLKKHIM